MTIPFTAPQPEKTPMVSAPSKEQLKYSNWHMYWSPRPHHFQESDYEFYTCILGAQLGSGADTEPCV